MKPRKLPLAVATLALAVGSFSAALPAAAPAYANDCQGVNSREAYGGGGGGMAPQEQFKVKMDSCHTAQLIEGFGTVKDATNFGALVGSKWWEVGVAAAPFYAWAWSNQESLKACAANGTGVSFKEINTLVVGCEPQ